MGNSFMLNNSFKPESSISGQNWANCEKTGQSRRFFLRVSETEQKQKQSSSEMLRREIIIFLLFLLPLALESATDCSKLRVGQFICPDPDSSYKYIDERTQSVVGCKKDGTAMGKIIETKLFNQRLMISIP